MTCYGKALPFCFLAINVSHLQLHGGAKWQFQRRVRPVVSSVKVRLCVSGLRSFAGALEPHQGSNQLTGSFCSLQVACQRRIFCMHAFIPTCYIKHKEPDEIFVCLNSASRTGKFYYIIRLRRLLFEFYHIIRLSRFLFEFYDFLKQVFFYFVKCCKCMRGFRTLELN